MIFEMKLEELSIPSCHPLMMTMIGILILQVLVISNYLKMYFSIPDCDTYAVQRDPVISHNRAARRKTPPPVKHEKPNVEPLINPSLRYPTSQSFGFHFLFNSSNLVLV